MTLAAARTPKRSICRRAGRMIQDDVMSSTQRGRIGSSFDDFLDEECIREEVEAQARKEVLAWQTEQEKKAAGLTKTAMTRRISTSRAELDRLLDPANTEAVAVAYGEQIE